jgi:putative membrane protein
MLLVHPVHEALRELPLLIGGIVVGSTTGNQSWTAAVLAWTVAVGVARWFTTTYRIDADPESGQVQLRTGLLQRKVLSLPRNRIRSVQSDARLLHRLLGLAVLRVSTGQQAKGEHGSGVFELNAVRVDEVPRLRSILLAASTQPADAAATPVADDGVLARWQPSWLRFSPLSVSGLLTIIAAGGVVYQSGFIGPLRHWRPIESALQVAQRLSVAGTVGVIGAVILVASVVIAVVRSLLTWGNLVLSRQADVLHLRHGLLRLRERTYDISRLRGGTLREPLLVRIFGGARLDAVMTGVHGAGESSVLLPPCPVATAESVLTGLVGDPDVVTGPLRGHGRRAASRRWTRALAVPVLVGLALATAAALWGIPVVPVWVWPAWVAATAWCALLAADRAGALGHRVDDRWVVMRAGSVERRRDCIAAAGVVGWTVRQSPMQRRAGVATLVAATAAGVKRYPLIDVPEDRAWEIAAQASPWVADSIWAVAAKR